MRLCGPWLASLPCSVSVLCLLHSAFVSCSVLRVILNLSQYCSRPLFFQLIPICLLHCFVPAGRTIVSNLQPFPLIQTYRMRVELWLIVCILIDCSSGGGSSATGIPLGKISHLRFFKESVSVTKLSPSWRFAVLGLSVAQTVPLFQQESIVQLQH